MKQDRATRVRIGADEAVELVLGADVDAAGRIEQQQDAAFGEQPLGDGDLLLVAAGKRADARPQRPAVNVDPVEDRLHRRGLAPAVDQRPAHETVDHRQGRVVLAAQLQRQRLGLAVLGDEADADVGAHGVGRRGDHDRLAVDPQSPRRHVGHAEAGKEKIELSHALKSGDAENLAGAQAERGVAELAGRRDALGGEDLGAESPRGPRAAGERRGKARARRSCG